MSSSTSSTSILFEFSIDKHVNSTGNCSYTRELLAYFFFFFYFLSQAIYSLQTTVHLQLFLLLHSSFLLSRQDFICLIINAAVKGNLKRYQGTCCSPLPEVSLAVVTQWKFICGLEGIKTVIWTVKIITLQDFYFNVSTLVKGFMIYYRTLHVALKKVDQLLSFEVWAAKEILKKSL